jgi:hypothetical protein
MKNLITPEHLTYGDSRYLEAHLEEIWQLVEINPFSERILHLLKNPQLAKTLVPDGSGNLQLPNCGGTSLFIVGIIEFPRYASYQEVFAIDPILPSIIREGMSTLEIIREQDRVLFGSGFEKRIPGAIRLNVRDSDTDYHAGVYLGRVESFDVVFTKHGQKGGFGPEIEESSLTGRYHLPKTLERIRVVV